MFQDFLREAGNLQNCPNEISRICLASLALRRAEHLSWSPPHQAEDLRGGLEGHAHYFLHRCTLMPTTGGQSTIIQRWTLGEMLGPASHPVTQEPN